MAIQHIERLDGQRRLGWRWGLLGVTMVVLVGVVVPAAALFLLGGDPGWASGLMAAGVLAAWMALLAVLRLGQRRAWWR
jgi:hypothetical protein